MPQDPHQRYAGRGERSELRCRGRAHRDGEPVRCPVTAPAAMNFYNTPTPADAQRHLQGDRPRPRGLEGRLIDNTSPNLIRSRRSNSRRLLRYESSTGAETFETRRRAGVVELALVLPIFLLLLLGIIQFGTVFRDYIALTDATRVGARQASVSRSICSRPSSREAASSPGVAEGGRQPRHGQDDHHGERRDVNGRWSPNSATAAG